jgi:hypothetical protein
MTEKEKLIQALEKNIHFQEIKKFLDDHPYDKKKDNLILPPLQQCKRFMAAFNREVSWLLHNSEAKDRIEEMIFEKRTKVNDRVALEKKAVIGEYGLLILPILQYKTLTRLFKTATGKTENEHYRPTLNSIKVFLHDYEGGEKDANRDDEQLLIDTKIIPKAEVLQEQETKDQDHLKKSLCGHWFVFRHDYSRKGTAEIRRTRLHIFYDDEGVITADVRSLSNHFTGGQVTLKKGTMTLSFDGKQKVLEITSHIDAEEIKGGTVFNALIRSTREQDPYTKPAILMYAEDQSPSNADLVASEFLTIYHKTQKLDGSKKNYLQDEKLNPIVEYLTRKRRWLLAMPFKPANAKEGIAERNNEGFGSTLRTQFYDDLTKKLPTQLIYIAPNIFDDPHRNLNERTFSINTYKIIFDYIRKECRWECTRGDIESRHGGSNFHGYVEYNKNQIVFIQEVPRERGDDAKTFGDRIKLYCVLSSLANGHFFGKTSLILVENKYSTLEFMLNPGTAKLPKARVINYVEFVKLRYLQDQEKEYLLSHLAEADEWPVFTLETDLSTQRTEQLSGDFFIYMKIPTNYPGVKDSLFQITLSIDRLGFFKERISYGSSDREYYGQVQMSHNKLRLIGKDRNGRISQYLININMEALEFMTSTYGINLSIDKSGFPSADRCLMVRAQLMKTPFVSNTVKPGSPVYNSVAQYIGNHQSIITRFFASIREEDR